MFIVLAGTRVEFSRERAVVLSNQVRTETRTTGGGSVKDGSGDVRIKTDVTTRQDILVRIEHDGTERRISTANEELVCREGSELDLIHAVLPSGTAHHTHVVNVNTNDRRVLKHEAALLCLRLTSPLPSSVMGWVGFAALFLFPGSVTLQVAEGLLGLCLAVLLAGIVSFAARAALNWVRYVSSSVPWTAGSAT